MNGGLILMRQIENDQPRWKSKVLWIAILSQILGLLLLNDIIDVGLAEQIEQSAVYFLNILVLVGIINVPTDKDHF